MKTRKFLVLSLVLVLLVLCLCACGAKEKEPMVLTESENFIVIKPTNDLSGTPLIDVMKNAKSSGQFDFTYEDTQYGAMIKTINGVGDPTDNTKAWMLYTSDTEHANTAWGQVEYQSNVYGSATLGASALNVIENGIYIWVYQSF